MTHIKVNTNPWQYPNVCFTCHHMRRIKFEFRPTQIDFIRWFLNLCATNKGVNPPRLQILRIDGDWVIDDVIVQGTWRHFLEKNVRKRCCFNCNIWPNWFTFHQSHYCLYYNGILAFVWKRSFINRKIAQTTQNIWYFIIRESNLQEMANFGHYAGDFRL